MKYQVTLEIPCNTPEDTPVYKEIQLPYGKLVEASIYFPWGCAGWAHVRIKHNESVLYPTSADEWFAGNEICIEFECAYELSEAWNAFKIEGFNEDDFYEHTPIISFVVLPYTGLISDLGAWVEG